MPLETDVDITPAGQRPDEDPSLAVRNNGGAAPAATPAAANSFSSAEISALFWSLIGLTPPKWW